MGQLGVTACVSTPLLAKPPRRSDIDVRVEVGCHRATLAGGEEKEGEAGETEGEKNNREERKRGKHVESH